ncbi:MAG TPA: threonine--tRNA ligase [Polyangiales bacterium]|nr:threonine--tRNA ligase [Polyangiales bacterium]
MGASATEPTKLRTPHELLQAAGKLKPNVIAVRAGGRIVDLHTPVPENTPLVPVDIDEPEALAVIRHSTAHVLADAVQRLYPGTKITFGPAIENGFYYDFDRRDGQFSDADFEVIEAKMREIIKSDVPFRREVVTRDQARELLTKMGEAYKVEHLERLEGEISLYRHGDWVDLCEGPHVPSTGYLRAVKLTSVAGAYWRGDERNPMLQRIYGTAFPSQKELDAHLRSIEEAKKRDHRKLGKELELIGFHKWAPASPFFLPRGAQVYRRLIDYVRELYDRTGYHEVVTPQVFDRELFETSGHLPAYGENMFVAASIENIEHAAEAIAKGGSREELQAALQAQLRFGIKPMNCPSHCLMFGMTRRSYRELPMRIADFGRLHRFERSGVTQGLTRVRTFCQDDAHIFCTLDQMQPEISGFIDMVYRVYQDFAFSSVRVVIATRPDTRLGDDAIWDRSEQALITSVEAKQLPYEIAPGEGAFYGPKIEFHLKDALGRPWQLGTIQVDFNMPERFELAYIGEDNSTHRPVMLHRAILGSIERFFGVLVEHVGGAFPVWLAPEQVAVLTVSEKVNDYAAEVLRIFQDAGVRTIADTSADKLGAKIRNARNLRVPYLAVIGQKEAEERGVSVRSRDENKDIGLLKLDEFVARVRAEAVPPSLRTGQSVERTGS